MSSTELLIAGVAIAVIIYQYNKEEPKKVVKKSQKKIGGTTGHHATRATRDGTARTREGKTSRSCRGYGGTTPTTSAKIGRHTGRA